MDDSAEPENEEGADAEEDGDLESEEEAQKEIDNLL